MPITVDVPTVARRLGHKEPTPELAELIEEAIAEAEADVTAYLHRAIVPEDRTVTGRWPSEFGWDLPRDEPVLEVVTAMPELWPDGTLAGTFTVVYKVGLNYRDDDRLAPIARYVRAAAENNPTVLRHLALNGERGPVKSVSVSTEGQSKTVTYADSMGTGGGGAAGSDSPGALPSLKTLDRWRKRSIYQGPAR